MGSHLREVPGPAARGTRLGWGRTSPELRRCCPWQANWRHHSGALATSCALPLGVLERDSNIERPLEEEGSPNQASSLELSPGL